MHSYVVSFLKDLFLQGGRGEGMKRLQGGAGSDPAPSPELSLRHSKEPILKTQHFPPEETAVPITDKNTLFFLLTGNSRTSPPAWKGQCLPSCHTHPPDRFNELFFFSLLLTHRIFINFLVSINLAACYFWGGRRRETFTFSIQWVLKYASLSSS